MFHLQKHKLVMVEILKSIYSDKLLAPNLGFKGGTAMYLFYALPRFSVDLDFDVLNPQKENAIFERLGTVLKNHARIEESRIKRFNLFFLLNYGAGERKIKVEVNRRQFKREYELKNFLGVPAQVMAVPSLAAHKLLAILGRKQMVARDLFDAWFMLRNNWQIDEEIVKENSGKKLKSYLTEIAKAVAKFPEENLLAGLGELLLSEKQKFWVKTKLKSELLFEIKKYQL